MIPKGTTLTYLPLPKNHCSRAIFKRISSPEINLKKYSFLKSIAYYCSVGLWKVLPEKLCLGCFYSTVMINSDTPVKFAQENGSYLVNFHFHF